MHKRFTAILLAGLLSLCGLGLFSGCSGNPSAGDYSEEIDETRTQLYVYNYNGGYGTEWLSRAKEAYEELHKDDVYEQGKKGIQIMINATKNSITTTTVKENTDEVYFAEKAFYYQYIAEDAFADITEAITGENPYEPEKTLYDKLSESQRDYFGVQEDGATKYYGIPHFSGAYGIVYDIDLFDQKGYYFKKGYENETVLDEKFIYYDDDVKSAGPDGEEGTDDDGLPATYEDFFDLCRYIRAAGDVPVSWTGQYYQLHLDNLATSLAANYEGMQQWMLNYNFNGTANDLVTSIGQDGTVNTESLPINEDNGYELQRQAGRYYALKFIEELVKTDSFHNEDAFNGSYSHMDNQQDFLMSATEQQKIAMSVEGVWWQSEAKEVFSDMAGRYGEGYSQNNRNIGWMTLPRATADKVNPNVQDVMLDCLYSLCFVKSTIADWKLDIAIDFIQFVNSDEWLVDFTLTTNTMKALNYTLESDDLAQMTPFGRSLVSFMQQADVVYPYASASKYVNNQSMFQGELLFQSRIDSTDRSSPSNEFHVRNVTAEDYFYGLKVYYENIWLTL